MRPVSNGATLTFVARMVAPVLAAYLDTWVNVQIQHQHLYSLLPSTDTPSPATIPSDFPRVALSATSSILGSPSPTASAPPLMCCSPLSPVPNLTDSSPPSLLPFELPADPSFTWGTHFGTECVQLILKCYNETIHWKANLLKIPNGKAGENFIKELSRLFCSYAEGSSMESIGLTAAFLLPILVLQKPPSRLKSKEIAFHLSRRLKLWSCRRRLFTSYMEEGRTIQKGLTTHPSPSHQKNESIARSFTNLMFAGKVREAIRLLSRNPDGEPLSLDAPAFPDNPGAGSVLDHLLLKHPQPGQVINSSVVLPETPPPDHSPHFVAYEGIDGLLIRSIALKTFGSAGPSSLDSYTWRRMCSSFGDFSADLCSSVAAVARRLCSSYIDPQCVRSLLSCRLIALNKLPGVRPKWGWRDLSLHHW